MKYALTIVGCLAMSAGRAATPSLLPDRVERAMQQRIAVGEYPTMVVAVVDGPRSDIYTFGRLDDGRSPDARTVYEIGSVTKTFTATLLAESVNKGDLRLDQPVASLLTDFSIPSRDGKLITLGTLAMQDSGLPRMPTNFVPANNNDPYADYGVEKLKAFLASYSLPRDPGAKYEYSNLGVGLLGYALSRHAGESYEKLLQQRIFAPLAMHDSGITSSADMQRHLAQGHDEAGKVTASWHLNVLAPAGGIRSTGADMLRYLRANMGVLPTSLYSAMQLAQLPRAAGPGIDNRIGLVWMTQHRADGDVIWHNGMTGGYASFMGFTADRRRGVVILTNAATQVDDLGFAVLRPDWPLALVSKQIAMAPQTLDEYQGTYQLAPKFLLKVFRVNDQLMAQATGQGPFPIFPSAKDEFFAKITSIAISFKRNGQDKLTGLVLHQNGDHAASKLSDAEADALQGNKQIKLDPSVLPDYVGSYELAPGRAFVVTVQNGQLMVKLGNQPAFPVYASSRDKFFYRVVDAKIDFERDANGKIVALVLHQNGADQRAPRMNVQK